MAMWDLSIVVVHYRTPDLLQRLLEALGEASLLERTVVVDCASPGFDEAAFRDRFATRFVCLPLNRGYAFAVNRGIAHTRGDPILLLNADILLSAKDVEDLLGIWRDLARPAAVGPLHLNAAGHPQLTFGANPAVWNEWRRRRLEHALRRGDASAIRRVERACQGTREVSWVSGSCMLMDREAVQTVGPWDENYFVYFEDMEWCLRAAKAGYRVYHTGEVAVLHEHGASMATSPGNAEAAYRQSQLRFFSQRWGPVARDLLYAYLRLARRWRDRDLNRVQLLGGHHCTLSDALSPAAKQTHFACRQPRVLHVVASLQGGAAEHVRVLAREQIRRGWDAWVCTSTGDGSTAPLQSWSGIPLTGCDFDLKSLGRGIRQLRRLIRRGQWTVIHLHGHRAGAIGRASALLLEHRPRVVVTYHGYHPPHYRTRRDRILATALERLLRRRTDHFIAVSPSTAHDVIRCVAIDPAQLSMIPNAIDTKTYAHCRASCREEARQNLGLAPEDYAVFCVGRIHRQKGVRYFLEALLELNEQWTVGSGQWTVAGGRGSRRAKDGGQGAEASRGLNSALQRIRGFIAGDGPEGGELAARFGDLVQEGWCVFLGWCADVPTLLAAADLLVLPSLWEGCPLVVLEAWAAGVPVVCTDVPGTTDMILDGENGLLVPPRDPHALADAIARIYRQRELARHLVRGGQVSLATYSLSCMADQTMRTYERQLTATPKPASRPASMPPGPEGVSAP